MHTLPPQTSISKTKHPQSQLLQRPILPGFNALQYPTHVPNPSHSQSQQVQVAHAVATIAPPLPARATQVGHVSTPPVHSIPARAALPHANRWQATPDQAQVTHTHAAPPVNGLSDESAFITLPLMNTSTGVVDIMKVKVPLRGDSFSRVTEIAAGVYE